MNLSVNLADFFLSNLRKKIKRRERKNRGEDLFLYLFVLDVSVNSDYIMEQLHDRQRKYLLLGARRKISKGKDTVIV